MRLPFMNKFIGFEDINNKKIYLGDKAKAYIRNGVVIEGIIKKRHGLYIFDENDSSWYLFLEECYKNDYTGSGSFTFAGKEFNEYRNCQRYALFELM